MKLLFASRNPHKIHELNTLLQDKIQIIGMEEAGVLDDIPETADTLEGNAYLKARYLYDLLENDCIAEDTGLEVTALNMQPGVHSARYAGEEKQASKNIDKLLHELIGKDDRSARFRSVISLIIDDAVYTFEGEVRGRISEKPTGHSGFGYDPVFIPDGYSKSFGELPEEVKIGISHRTRAMQKCIRFLDHYLKCKSPLSAELRK
jgi:XTP/dITP diphosphohydrolase